MYENLIQVNVHDELSKEVIFMKSIDAIVKDLQRQGIRAEKVNIKQINRHCWIIFKSSKEPRKHSI